MKTVKSRLRKRFKKLKTHWRKISTCLIAVKLSFLPFSISCFKNFYHCARVVLLLFKYRNYEAIIIWNTFRLKYMDLLYHNASAPLKKLFNTKLPITTGVRFDPELTINTYMAISKASSDIERFDWKSQLMIFWGFPIILKIWFDWKISSFAAVL